MPSNIGKTTKRGTTKRVAGRSRSASHRESTLEWLRKDPTHAAALLEAALETGDAGDFMAALRTVTEARGGVSKIPCSGRPLSADHVKRRALRSSHD